MKWNVEEESDVKNDETHHNSVREYYLQSQFS